MSKRERLEDLGRVCEKLSVLIDHEVFDWKDKISHGLRCKDVCEYFFQLDLDKQSDILHDLGYQIEYIKEQLQEIYHISRWGDEDSG